jgi:hypothetical protein
MSDTVLQKDAITSSKTPCPLIHYSACSISDNVLTKSFEKIHLLKILIFYLRSSSPNMSLFRPVRIIEAVLCNFIFVIMILFVNQ